MYSFHFHAFTSSNHIRWQKCKCGISGIQSLSHSHTDAFWQLCSRWLLKTLLQVVKFLTDIMSNLSFNQNVLYVIHWLIIPFPHLDAFWRLCSRWLENIVEIAQTNFFFSVLIRSFIEIFSVLTRCFQSRLLQICFNCFI